MSENVFFEFKKENVLDELLRLFENKGLWQLDKSKFDFFHNYQWPDIILADRKRSLKDKKLDGYAIELLGSYSKNEEEIGQVTLYMPSVFRCVEDFLKFKGKTDNSFENIKVNVEILSEIILIHEFIHWLVEMGESPKSTQIWGETQEKSAKFGLGERHYISKLPDFKYDDNDSIKYHESFAQIFTNYYCNKIGGIHWEQFEWLEKQQQTQYTVYKDLFPGIWAGRDMIIDGVIPDQRIQMIQEEQLEQVFDLLNFTRELDCQSFEVLQVLSKNYQPEDKSNKCRLFFEKIIKSTHIEANFYNNAVNRCGSIHPDLIDENKGTITGKKYGL